MTDDEIKALQADNAKWKGEAETAAKAVAEWRGKAEGFERQIAAGDPEGVTKRISALTTRAKAAEESVAATNERIAALTSTHAEDLALVRAGLDDEDALAIARRHHGTLPEADRPPLVDLVKTWREKPDTAPRLLRPIFDGGGKASGGDPAPKKPDPSAGAGRGGHGDPAPAKGGYTAAQLAAMTPAEYAAARDAAIKAGKSRNDWYK